MIHSWLLKVILILMGFSAMALWRICSGVSSLISALLSSASLFAPEPEELSFSGSS
jgi:hypothetical protein